MVARVQPEAPAFSAWNGVFSGPAFVVLSASYNPLHLPLRPGSIHVRAEALTGSVDEARALAEKLGVYLALFHGAESSVGTQGTDPDVKEFFDGLKVGQEADRATVSATVPPGFLKKLIAEPQEGMPVARPSSAERAPVGSR
jgi:hypothetical protein